ncbi:MAG: single-stranded-DNA-specific exonuclease RecJ [Synechococcaceae cyanobacterium]
MRTSPRPAVLSDSPALRWRLPPPLPAAPQGEELAAGLDLPAELVTLLQRRGHADAAAIRALLEPPEAPDPHRHFADLERAEARLEQACRQGEAVAICGDYDADGMTSTALLTGVLQRLGAHPHPAIPSRQDDGYGLNVGMVERLAAEGIRLLITVDNGVAAREALERAEALGVAVILTDHHTLPEQLPPHLALLHPARTPEDSPFRGLAGVGLAYVLASALCRRLRRRDGLAIALDLFCIGTIADMAPLQGVNRRWLMDGLPQLAQSRLAGLRALQQLAGVEERPLDAEAVAFRLAPRINAVGRLGDPLMVVELLTSEDSDRALELARQCEGLNRQRRELCDAIEAEALALLEADGPRRPAFLLLAQSHWHHGVIGIVASRLVDRFALPVALLAGEGDGRLRASVRAPRGFAVDRALQACADLLERHGGHPAAGGFTVRAEAVGRLQERLEAMARDWLGEQGEGPLVEPELQLPLSRVDRAFWQQLQRLEPFGVGHPAPVFWSSGCRLVSCRRLRGGHLELVLAQDGAERRALAWGWSGPEPTAALVDVAWRLKLDHWQGQERLQLELVGLRARGGEEVVLRHRRRSYWCRRQGEHLLIRNAAGEELQVALATALAPHQPESPLSLDLREASHQTLREAYVCDLARHAAQALGIST